MYKEPSKAPSKIEQTKRDMYQALEGIKSLISLNCVPPTSTIDNFESFLEEHLQALNAIADQAQQDAITARQEHLSIQGRLQSVDHAYSESQKLLAISGDEVRRLHKEYGRDRQDLMEAEKLSDELDEKLRDAQAVIGRQEQLIAGQRMAITELYMSKNRSDKTARQPSAANCAHEFHPSFPGGERCIYCCEVKP